MKRTLILLSCAAFLAGCGSVQSSSREFTEPNTLIKGEIQQRIDQIQYQHREELMNNLLWLANQGEHAMGQLNEALRHEEPKVRSSVVWCLGRMGDRRAVPHLQALVSRETDETVRLEASRTLLLLGDFAQTATLINGLESERRHVRYLCHEALRSQTGHDFGYDHRSENAVERAGAVAQWRNWWAEQSGDRMLRTGRGGAATVDFSIVPPTAQQQPRSAWAGTQAPRTDPPAGPAAGSTAGSPAGTPAGAPRDPWSALQTPSDDAGIPLGAAPGGAAGMPDAGSRPASRTDRQESRPASSGGR
jgi:hypothetical protein